MAIRVDRTYICDIRNQSQVRDPLDACGYGATKLWNVARWTTGRIWDALGYVPDTIESDLKSYLKTHERYKDLQNHSAQRVLEELGEAFDGCWAKRNNSDQRANPPGYRKRYYADGTDEHPRSTVTWKKSGIRFDPKHGYVRLSKGKNHKQYYEDFILCALEVPPTFPDDPDRVDLRQVRAVYDEGRDVWTAHLICKVETDAPDTPGDRTAGVDLGISNIAAVSFSDETLLFPGGWLKETKHYYTQIQYDCEGENGASERSRWASRKLRRKRHHFQHKLSKRIIDECVARNVGQLYVGDLGGIRDGEDGDARNWGRHNNKRLHGWAFSKLTDMLEYKGEAAGIEVVVDTERDTSKTCCVCGTKDDDQRVERGLYVCEECGFVGNADCNGAENIRTLLPSPERHAPRDRDNGCLAQPATYLFDATDGRFRPHSQEQVRCEP